MFRVHFIATATPHPPPPPSSILQPLNCKIHPIRAALWLAEIITMMEN